MHRLVVAILAFVVAACTSAGSASPSPAASGTAAASVTPVTSPAPSPSNSPAASARPSVAASALPSPSPCAPLDESGPIESQVLIDVRVDSSATGGRVTFVFGPPDPEWPAGPPAAAFAAAEPPFDQTASGQSIEVPGTHHVRARFTNMKLMNDDGAPTYDGPNRIVPSSGQIKSVVLEEAFEGVMSWVIGYDGSGCASVETSADGRLISVVIGG